eukprot:5549444-Prymnesium_polylepis.1
MPTEVEEGNVSRHWWPSASTFVLFSMKGTSMAYHLDLWATAVLYVVLWGCKLFVLAPPTPGNLKLMQATAAPTRLVAHTKMIEWHGQS